VLHGEKTYLVVDTALGLCSGHSRWLGQSL